MADGVEHMAADCTPVEVAAASVVVLPGAVSQPPGDPLRPAPTSGGLLPVTGAGGGVGDLLRVGLFLVLAGVALTMLSGRAWPAWPGR